jgi:hypothetical protein
MVDYWLVAQLKSFEQDCATCWHALSCGRVLSPLMNSNSLDVRGIVGAWGI